jgi:hypothetical protein
VGGELPATTVQSLEPHALLRAFHIVYGVLAAFVALGAWIAWRVPPVPLDPAGGELAGAAE